MVHEFLDQCAGHCLNAIVKDKNVEMFYISFIIEKARSQLAFSGAIIPTAIQLNSG